jgi:hypothetical protein
MEEQTVAINNHAFLSTKQTFFQHRKNIMFKIIIIIYSILFCWYEKKENCIYPLITTYRSAWWKSLSRLSLLENKIKCWSSCCFIKYNIDVELVRCVKGPWQAIEMASHGACNYRLVAKTTIKQRIVYLKFHIVKAYI